MVQKGYSINRYMPYMYVYIYMYTYIHIYIYIYIYIAEMQERKRQNFLFCISAINALYFVHRAPYGGEDTTLYVIYIYTYKYIHCRSIS